MMLRQLPLSRLTCASVYMTIVLVPNADMETVDSSAVRGHVFVFVGPVYINKQQASRDVHAI